MRFFILMLTLISTANAADWTGFKGCGLYKVNGVVRFQKNIPVLIVNEKTRSEITIHVPIKNEPAITSHIDMPVEAQVQLNKAMNGSIGEGEVLSAQNRLPHPLNPMDTGLTFIKKGECLK
jgi:hypothetical protein